MPEYTQRFGDELIADFRDVAGQRESSITPPPNVSAGVAMQTAAELGDEILGPILRRLGRSIEKEANIHLLLMNQEYDENRKIKILGESGSALMEWLDKVDLRNHTDVHIEIESMFPDFRGAKRQTLMDLWDRRIIVDPATFLRAFRYGSFDVPMEQLERAQDKIHLAIADLKRGKEHVAEPGDDHLKFVQELGAWINTPEFLRLIPERKQKVLAALQAHMMFLSQGQGMPMGGAPMAEQNQNAVGTPFGSQVPVGNPGAATGG
jgi:hypothetical protein